VPGAGDRHAEIVDRMASYVQAYADLGGMQIQLNVVSRETLRRAMADPAGYRDLLVRVPGHNAYFVERNRELQLVLVGRSEPRLS
jgi:formate C-acetyltransferase